MDNLIDIFVEYCKTHYSDELAVADERSYLYKSLPICIVDCVYSLRARYQSVTIPIVDRYADVYLDSDKTSEKDDLRTFISHLDEMGLENFADDVAKNHQVLGGVPKAEVCYNLAKTLQELKIDNLQDFQNYPNRTELTEKIKTVKGIGNAGVNYLFMLTGDNSKTKPDVHIHACMREVFGKDLSDDECQAVISGAAEKLRKNFPELTARKLDGVIWRDFSSR